MALSSRSVFATLTDEGLTLFPINFEVNNSPGARVASFARIPFVIVASFFVASFSVMSGLYET